MSHTEPDQTQPATVDEAGVVARAIRRAPRVADAAYEVGRGSAWARLRYRLIPTLVFPERVDETMKPTRAAVMSKIGLHRGALKAAVSLVET